MVEVDEFLYSGKNLAVIMQSDWVTLSKERLPGTPIAFDLKVRPVMTFLKYLRSIHVPEGLSTTTSVSKTVGQSDGVSVDASVSTTVSAGIGIVEDETEFSLSVGYSHTWESSRTTEDSYTLTGPASIYFYQPVTIMAYLQAGQWPLAFVHGTPQFGMKVTRGGSYMLSSVMQDKTIGLNKNVGLMSLKAASQYLFNAGWKTWKHPG